jgi:hypothetical protein
MFSIVPFCSILFFTGFFGKKSLASRTSDCLNPGAGPGGKMPSSTADATPAAATSHPPFGDGICQRATEGIKPTAAEQRLKAEG